MYQPYKNVQFTLKVQNIPHPYYTKWLLLVEYIFPWLSWSLATIFEERMFSRIIIIWFDFINIANTWPITVTLVIDRMDMYAWLI